MESLIKVRLEAGMKALQTGNPRDAVEALTPALQEAIDRGLPREEMLVSGLLAPARAQLGELGDAVRLAGRARELAGELGDRDSETHYAELEARIRTSLTSHERALMPLSDAEIEQALDQGGEALTWGDHARARQILEPLAQAMRDRRRSAAEASASGMLAQALVMAGEEAPAREHAVRAGELAEAMGDEHAAAHFAELVASLDGAGARETVERSRLAAQAQPALDAAREALEAERFGHAIAELQPVVESAHAGGAPMVEATARGLLAQALLMAERREEAARHAERALELARAEGEEEAIESFTQLLVLTSGWKAPIGEA